MISAEPLLRALKAQDEILVAKGYPPISPWWWSLLTRFLMSLATLLCVRTGRQAGKSTTFARIATAIAVFIDHPLPPGTRGIVAFVSVTRKEAQERLYNIAAILRALEEPFERTEDEITLLDRPIVFRVYAASFRTSVGGTFVALFLDELARWRDNEASGANPASEIVASLLPALVTQPTARAFFASSPLGADDYHAQVMTRGDTAFQIVATAASWEANPTISVERTRELEPDDRIWRREYAAIPQVGASSAFDADEIAKIARSLRTGSEPLAAGAMFIDSSSGRGDGWAFGIAQFVVEPCGETIHIEERVMRNGVHIMTHPIHGPNGRMVPNPKYTAPVSRLYIDELGCIEGQFARTTPFAEVVAQSAAVAKAYGIRRCFGDQHLSFPLTGEYARHKIEFVEMPWTAPAKVEAAATLRRLLREGMIVVEPGDEAEAVKGDLMQLQERFTPSGELTITARRTGAGHADRAMLLMLIARAESEGAIAGSPMARRGDVTIYDPYTDSDSAAE